MARILVIDDSQDMLSMMQIFLEKRAKHQVILCANGEDGLKAATSQAPDVAIVDVMMPGLSGYEVVKRLRADSRTALMGIIVLTARGQPVDHDAALNAGADDFATKPINMTDLLTRVDMLLHKTSQAKAQAEARAASPQPAPPPQAPSVTQAIPATQASPTQAPPVTQAPALPLRAAPTKPAALKATVLSIFSLRGGIGRTTLAINLATLLQFVSPTVLLDLSPNSGHCALYLGLRSEKHWGHYLTKRDTPTENYVLRHPSGLQVVAAPGVPLEYGWFSEEDLMLLLEKLAGLARFIVVDTPPVLNQATETVLGQSQRILLVTGDDPPSLQTTATTLQATAKWKERIIITRNATDSGARPTTDAIARLLHTQIAADVPFDPMQKAALYKGVPLVAAQPKGTTATALKQVLRLVLSPPGATPE